IDGHGNVLQFGLLRDVARLGQLDLHCRHDHRDGDEEDDQHHQHHVDERDRVDLRHLRRIVRDLYGHVGTLVLRWRLVYLRFSAGAVPVEVWPGTGGGAWVLLPPTILVSGLTPPIRLASRSPVKSRSASWMPLLRRSSTL